MQRTPPELTATARALRTNATPAERLLWRHLRTFRPHFTRQLVISHYIADFACRSLRLAIELDGGHHASQEQQDSDRTAYVEANGWTVLRIWNTDVVANPDGVMQSIQQAVSCASTHPRPLPCREGSVT